MWHKDIANLRKTAKSRPPQKRDGRVFWRGKCSTNEWNIKSGPIPADWNDRPALECWRGKCRTNARRLVDEAAAPPRRRLTKSAETVAKEKAMFAARKIAYRTMKAEHKCKKDFGNRARLRAAALTVARPDLFAVTCSQLTPPKNFSCVPDEAAALYAARTATLKARTRVVDTSWLEPEDFSKHKCSSCAVMQTASRHRRGCHVETPPRRRVAAPPRPRRGNLRGDRSRRRRGRDGEIRSRPARASGTC